MKIVHWDIAEKFKDTMQIFVIEDISEKYTKFFCKSTKLIAPHVEPKKLAVFFTRKKLTIHLTHPNRIAEHMRVILYNLDKIDTIPDDRNLIAIFLEELVHAYYDEDDEIWVGKKVAELYPDILFNEEKGKYEFPTG